MKCPACGHWNQASLPRCFHCGKTLPSAVRSSPLDEPTWQEKLHDIEPEETYIHFEENSNVRLVPSKDIEHEVLGKEIESLKERRERGELQLATLRDQARRAKETIAKAAIIRPVEEPDPYEALIGARTIADLDDNARIPERKIPVAEPEPSPPGRRAKRRARQPEPAPPEPQDDWRGQTNAAWKAQSEFVYTDDENAPVLYDGYVPSPADKTFHMRGMEPDFMGAEREISAHSTARHSAISTTYTRGRHQTKVPQSVPMRQPRPRRRRNVMLVQWMAILGGTGAVIAAVVLGMNQLLGVLSPASGQAEDTTPANIVQTQINGLPAHTIWIPAPENTQVYIQELQKSYVVTGGMAEVQVEDYIWYAEEENVIDSVMEVTLTPTIRYSSSEQSTLPPIRYTIDVPLSEVLLIRPDSTYAKVSTSIFDLRLQVERGSRVTIDGTDVTDLIDANGRVTKNVSVQDIGENRIEVSVRSKYRRPNNFSVTLFREAQEIPLEMAADSLSETDGTADEDFLPDAERIQAYADAAKAEKTIEKKPQMKLYATTVPDATIQIETPHHALDLSNLSVDGSFSFVAEFPIVGDNEVRIRASQPGKQDSVLTHVIYYVPPVDVYTRQAWKFERSDYLDLVNNNPARRGQVYVCRGTIKEIISERPQLAIMDTSAPNTQQEQLVLLENNSKTTWQVGTYYRVYGDAFGMYGTMPRITGRFTYLD